MLVNGKQAIQMIVLTTLFEGFFRISSELHRQKSEKKNKRRDRALAGIGLTEKYLSNIPITIETQEVTTLTLHGDVCAI